MSSAGQIAGGIVGGIVGAFTPLGFVMGAQLGLMVGGYIDPPKGPNITGPRLSDLSYQSATYGAVIPRVHGTVATFGNVFWLENNQLKEVATTTEAGGGKGGGGQEQTTYSYFATFALGICQGPIDGVSRIWAGSKLIYDASDSSVGAIAASSEAIGNAWERMTAWWISALVGDNFAIYMGTEDQEPDDRMQATLGVANTPAYRGLAYIVFKDFPLEDYGNTLMGLQIKVEVVKNGSVEQFARRLYVDEIFAPFDTTYGVPDRFGPFSPHLENGVITVFKRYDANRLDSYTIDMAGNPLPPMIGVSGSGDKYFIGTVSAGDVVYSQTISSGGGHLKVGGTTFKTRDGSTTAAFCGAAVQDNKLYVLMSYSGVGALEVYDGVTLALISTAPQTIYVDTIVGNLPFVPGVNYGNFCVERGGKYLWALIAAVVASQKLYEIADDGTLTLIWSDTQGFVGQYGSCFCMAADNGLCWVVSNSVSLAIFDRNPILTPQTVTLASIVQAECISSGLLSAGDIDVTGLTQAVRGYRVASLGAIRAAIEPLQSAWPFDIVQDGYKIKFLMRGGAAVASVAEDDLGAINGTGKAVRITQSREMDAQLPRKVTITYIDAAREYDIGSGPGAERLNTSAVNELHSELPIVLTADEAAQIEERLLYLYWLERHELSFVLPPSFAALQPADVVTVSTGAATYSVRLVSINALPDGRMECSGRMNNAAVYLPSAVGQEGLATGQTLTYGGGSLAALLDIPCVDSTYMNTPGFVAAMDGYLDGWRGGSLFRSDDNGQTWAGVQGFNSPGCIIGIASNSIGSGATHVIDEYSLLTARIFSGALSSVTASALYNGANHFAYGAHGRWEIIGARTCAANADGTYTLSGLLRGRFGTERNMACHAIGDTLVLLDSAALRFIGMGIDSLNMARLYRAVSKGQSIDSVGDTSFVYAGENLECLSPVNVKGSKSAANDWTITWTRRTRTPVEPFSGLNAPLAESSEEYEVEIWNDSSYTTLKRTISGISSASATYTSADQVADFGAVQKYLYVKVYQLSATVGRGYPAASTVGPTHLINLKSLIHFDEGGSEFIPYRVLGLHCDGTNGSTTFTDVKGKTVTANGNAQISTAQYPALTGKTSSAYFDGTTDYLAIGSSADFGFGTGNFTIRGFINPSNVAGLKMIYDGRPGADGAYVLIYLNGASLVFHQGGTARITGGTISAGSFTHFEACRVGTTTTLYVAGASVGTWVDSTNYATTTVRIGADSFSAANGFLGYMSEIEVYKGAALHTANFTPPGSPFPDSVLPIIDKAENTITVTGSAAIASDASSFGGFCLQANQASGYVSIPQIDLTAEKWTIECFIKPDALPASAYMGIFDYGTAADGSGGACAVIRYDGTIMCFFAYGVEINGPSVAVGERAHIFIMRDGDRLYIGAKGTVGTSRLVSSTTFVGNKGFRIGYANVTGLETKAIKIDEWRVAANESKYPTSGTYTIPSISFPDP